VSVPHKSFSLRFSDLEEIEASCYEDEEERAVRAVDWISERIGQQSAKWVEEMEKYKGKEPLKSPWWEEVRRCAEGEHTPSRTETWNHPAAGTFPVHCSVGHALTSSASHFRCIYHCSEPFTSNYKSTIRASRPSVLG